MRVNKEFTSLSVQLTLHLCSTVDANEVILCLVISELLSSQWHTRLNDYNNTGKNAYNCGPLLRFKYALGGKRKENRDRDVQTQTERCKDYKCLRSSVNLHNQRQACPISSNRLCMHLCQPVFTSVGTKTTSNLQERDRERERGRKREKTVPGSSRAPRGELN